MLITKFIEESGDTRIDDASDVDVTITFDSYMESLSERDALRGEREYYRGKAEAYGTMLATLADIFLDREKEMSK